MSIPDWYRAKTSEIEALLSKGKPCTSLATVSRSPSARYKIVIQPMDVGLGPWRYCIGEVNKGLDTVGILRRPSQSIPIEWCENHPDGHDYLISAQHPQGLTILRLDKAEKHDWVSPLAEKDEGDVPIEFYVSPSKTILAVVYQVATFHRIIRFLDFRDPCHFPLPILSTYLGPWSSVEGFHDEENLKVTIDTELSPNRLTLDKVSDAERAAIYENYEDLCTIKREWWRIPVTNGLLMNARTQYLSVGEAYPDRGTKQ